MVKKHSIKKKKPPEYKVYACRGANAANLLAFDDKSKAYWVVNTGSYEEK